MFLLKKFGHTHGNALFLILIAVALFGALSYAVTQSGRGAGNISKEKAVLDTAHLNNYEAAITAAVLRLTMTGCNGAQISYETPSGANANPSAPVDKSCHVFFPQGGGVTWENLGIGAGCNLPAMAAGTGCNGIVYVGTASGKRIYTTAADTGSACFNNCTGNFFNVGATSASDGKANTNALVAATDAGAPYQAAQMCRTLGPEWYLPAHDQVTALYSYQSNGALAGTFTSGVFYKSSTENGSTAHGARNAMLRRFNDGYIYGDGDNKQYAAQVRCVRE